MQKGLLLQGLGSTVGKQTGLTFPSQMVARIKMIKMMIDRRGTDDAMDGTDGKRDARQEDESIDQTDDVQPEIGDARINVAQAGNDAAIEQRAAEPRRSYGPKKSAPPAAAPKRCQEASAGDQGTQIAKRPKCKVARKNILSQG